MSDAWRQWEGHIVDGRFPLREFQGSTDHSAVFVTSHGSLQEKAALKFLQVPGDGGQSLFQRWERTSKLSHPHLLRVFAWGKCNLSEMQFLYVVSEFAEENLAQILPSRPLSAQEAEFMLRSSVDVLGYLHGLGMVHARVKPANLMAVSDNLKLASESVCAAGDRSALPPLPTPYDAPELMTTGPSAAADIWALGVTLTEALTQKVASGTAFRGGRAILPEGTPATFVEIAQECLRLDPARRWTSREIAAHMLPAPPRTKTRPAYLPAALAVVGLGVLLVAGKLLWRQPEPKGNATSRARAVNPVPATPAPDAKAAPDKARSPDVDKLPEPAAAREKMRGSADSKSPNASAPTVPGTVLEQVVPSVSSRSLDTITGKVRVSVRVAADSSGHVAEASLASPGPSQYFARVALDAARKWKFSPPMQGGEPVASSWMLRFAFSRQGIKVEPAQLSP